MAWMSSSAALGRWVQLLSADDLLTGGSVPAIAVCKALSQRCPSPLMCACEANPVTGALYCSPLMLCKQRPACPSLSCT